MGFRALGGAPTWIGLGAMLLLSGGGIIWTSSGPEDASIPAMLVDPAHAVSAPTRIDWQGFLPLTACSPTGAESCSGVTRGERDDAYRFDSPGPRVRAGFEIRWDDAAPSPLRLTLSTVQTIDCGPQCASERFHTLGKVAGESPLTLDVADAYVEEGLRLVLLVHEERDTPEPLRFQFHAQLPFHVAGVVEQA